LLNGGVITSLSRDSVWWRHILNSMV